MKEKFLSYAQEYEDLILYHVLKDVKQGFYVDVGDNDPWEISVTKSFYELGWNGINIEPLEESYQELVADRKRDINCCVGAGSRNGTLTFYPRGAFSTCDGEMAEAIGNKVSKVIPVKKLTDIIKENIPNLNQEIHFCKIDVEGLEKDVLEGIDFTVVRPWIFVMEATIPTTGVPCHENWEYILTEAGYSLALQHGINRYYVENQKIALKNKFANPNTLHTIYDVFKCSRDYDRTRDIYYKIGQRVMKCIQDCVDEHNSQS